MRLHRRGRAQIKTAQQLAEELAVPVYYILIGKAQAAFPESSTPAPSPFVQVVRTGSGIDPNHVAAFPAYVNWRQWRDVLAPLLQDLITEYTAGGNVTPPGGWPGFNIGLGSGFNGGNPGSGVADGSYTNSSRWSNYLGYLGGTIGLGALPDAQQGRGVYTCNVGLRDEFLTILGNEIENRAIGAGYPSTA